MTGARVGLKLLACKGEGAIGIEGQLGVIVEATQVLQGFAIDWCFVSNNLHLEWNFAHFAILDEPISLPAQPQASCQQLTMQAPV